jgi:hypothetical protein
VLLAALYPLLGSAAATASPAPPVPIVTGPGDQTAPSVSAGELAYADDSTGARQVWVRDLVTGATTRYSGAAAVQGGPVLDHRVLAFAVASGVQVVALDDLGASVAIPAAGAAGVSASAQLVAWEQPGAGGRDVAFFPVGAAAQTVLVADGDEHAPSVSYAWVAWLDESGSGAIRLRDPAGTVTTPYPARAREVSLWASSRLTTPLLAAVVDGPAGGAELLVIDPSGVIRGRLAKPAELRRPRLGNEWVAFEDLGTGTSQVALWQWTTGRVVVPSPTSQPQLLNDLRVEDQVMRLAWADGRGGDLDVYLFEATLPLPDLPQGQARCDDPLAPVVADLLVRREHGRPATGAVVLSLPASAPVLTCVDTEGVCAAWVKVGSEAVASPADFSGGPCAEHRWHDDDHGHDDRRGKSNKVPAPVPSRHLESRLVLPAGDTVVSARVASAPGGVLRVRVLADGWTSPPRTSCIAGVDCPSPGPPGGWPGCASSPPGGLLALLLIPLGLWRAGRRRRR